MMRAYGTYAGKDGRDERRAGGGADSACFALVGESKLHDRTYTRNVELSTLHYGNCPKKHIQVCTCLNLNCE